MKKLHKSYKEVKNCGLCKFEGSWNWSWLWCEHPSIFVGDIEIKDGLYYVGGVDFNKFLVDNNHACDLFERKT
jgi:hypothetical protein